MKALAVAALLVSLAITPASARDVTISAAISMKAAVEALGAQFTRAHPGVTLRYNFAGSGQLQRQIEAGAPIDVFVSAGPHQMDALARQGLVVATSRRTFASNALVVVLPIDSGLVLARPDDLLDARVRRLVIGDPRTVPAGRYAAESLSTLGLWERLAPRLVYAENVRHALEYVARGEVDAGIVYATDVPARLGRVRIAFRPAADTYGPVLYPAAVVRDARQPDLAAAFVDLLLSAEGQAVLKRLGFLPPPGMR